MFDFYVKPDFSYIEHEIRGGDREAKEDAKNIKSCMSLKKRYPVLGYEEDYLLLSDDYNNLHSFHMDFFKMTGIRKYPRMSE